METLDQNIQSSDNSMKVSADAKYNLSVISKWAKFLAIMGFISVGILGIASIFMIGAGSTRSFGGGQLIGTGFTYLILAVVYIFPSLYLLRSANHLATACNKDSQGSFELGMENMKSLFKFAGIFTIVFISLYILIAMFAAFALSARTF